jgi:BCD family chlorophyll transporter-like MFS transporter
VMIAELGVSARPVAIIVALPLIFAPARALIGFRSDNYPLGAESGLRP